MTYTERICIWIFIISIWSCKTDFTSDEKISIGKNTSVDRVVVYSNNSPKGLNPIINVSTSPILDLVHVPLARYNPQTLDFEPLLIKYLPVDTTANDIRYKDKFAYYIEFKEGLTWNDGTRIDMMDYIFTVKLIKNTSINSPRFRAFFSDILDVIVSENGLGGFVILDKFNLNGIEKISNIPLIQERVFDPNHLLRSVTIPMLDNEQVYKQKEADVEGLFEVLDKFNTSGQNISLINGNGLYSIKEWKLDKFVELERKESHWSKEIRTSLEAKPKTIIYSFVSDAVAALPQIKNGEFDIVPAMDFNSFNTLENDPVQSKKFKFETVRLPRFYFVGLNMRKLILQQKEVRKALQMVVNVDTIISTMENGFGSRINSPFLNLGNDSEVSTIKFNPKKARQILADAGWKDLDQDGVLEKELNGKITPLKLSIIVTGKKLGNFIAALTRQDAAKIGIDIELVSMETSAMRKSVRAHDFDMIVSGSTSSLAPYDPYTGFHTNNVAPGKGNNYGFGNDESDELIDKIRSERDFEKRKKYYVELEKMIHDEVPMIFLYSPNERILMKKNLNCLLSSVRPGFFPNTAFFE